MNRLLILIILLLAQLSLSAQTDNYKKGYSIFEKEIRLFIDSARKRSVHGGLYNIYTVQLYNTMQDSNSLSFSVSYIENQDEYFYPNIPPRIFWIDTNIVLISCAPDYSSIWLNVKNFPIMDSTNMRLAKNKLPPDGIFISDKAESKLFVWYNNNIVKRHFYIDNRGDYLQDNCYNNVNNYGELKTAFECDSIFHDKERINIKSIPIPKVK